MPSRRAPLDNRASLPATSPAPPRVEGRLNRDSRGSVVPRRVGEVATRQRGVIAHRQLVSLAVSQDQITRWIDGGRLLHLHEGVYAVGHHALPRGGHFMAAVLAGGE